VEQILSAVVRSNFATEPAGFLLRCPPPLSAKVVTATLAETVLSPRIDDLEPRLTHYGYDVKSIAQEFHIKPVDVRLFLQGQLDLARSRELTEQMLVAGLPV
jgi:hypothetical protein